MALKTNYPEPKPPKEPQPKDQAPKPNNTLPEGPDGPYGTKDGVKPAGTSFEVPEIETPKTEQEKEAEKDK